MEHMPILKKCFKQCISPYAASTNVLSFTTCIAVKHRLVRSTKRSTSHLKPYAEFYACTILCVPKFSRQARYYCTITGTTGTTDHLFKASNVSPSLFYITNSKKIPCIFYRIKNSTLFIPVIMNYVMYPSSSFTISPSPLTVLYAVWPEGSSVSMFSNHFLGC